MTILDATHPVGVDGGACKVLLIVPCFGDSFWNVRVSGGRYPTIPLGLITVAALLPRSWECRLVDRNVDSLNPQDLDWADMVMTGGMLAQRSDTLAVIALAQAHAKPVVVGGPDPTSCPDVYGAADFRVLGEVETIMADFVSRWDSGARSGLFTATPFSVDVTTSPVPRFDLLDPSKYMFFGVQFSRGCPFNCEFCDIIELYGRVPRAKSPAQILGELTALYEAGYRGQVDFVDDNLIGNKKALRILLPQLIAWQAARGYPFKFSTEASLNLADDDALLAMMRQANFFTVFIGIESPDTDTLIQAQKKQNTRRSIADSVHKIYRSGIFATAGFIVGFDTEKGSVAQPMIDCIEEAAIPVCMVGLLYALPNTQLTRRLKSEGRLWVEAETLRPVSLETADHTTAGLNFQTLRPRRDILADHRQILAAVYDPRAFFRRVRKLGRRLDRFRPPSSGLGALRTRVGLGGVSMADLKVVARMVWRLMTRDRRLGFEVGRTVADCLRHNPSALQAVVTMCIYYLHMGPFSQSVIAEMDRAIAWEDVLARRLISQAAEDIGSDGPDEQVRVGHAPRRLDTQGGGVQRVSESRV